MFGRCLQIFFIYQICLRNLGVKQLDGRSGEGSLLPRRKLDAEFVSHSPEPQNTKHAPAALVHVTQTHCQCISLARKVDKRLPSVNIRELFFSCMLFYLCYSLNVTHILAKTSGARMKLLSPDHQVKCGNEGSQISWILKIINLTADTVSTVW